jgi:hypothetical protein
MLNYSLPCIERGPPKDHPSQFAFIWFSDFRGENLNMIFYQNMPNLHNWYKSAERKISQKKNPGIYVTPCHVAAFIF